MSLDYQPAKPSDFQMLAEIRIVAMRDSLESLGRFNRERSMERFRGTFSPLDTVMVLASDGVVGFYALTDHGDHLLLDHLYVVPQHQSQGIGTAVMERIIERSKASGLPVKLGALKGSRSNDFYRRHGFVRLSEGEWDIYYERPLPNPNG